MIAACSEHLERAIDEFVEGYRSSPDISRCDIFGGLQCAYCLHSAEYLIKEYADAD